MSRSHMRRRVAAAFVDVGDDGKYSSNFLFMSAVDVIFAFARMGGMLMVPFIADTGGPSNVIDADALLLLVASLYTIATLIVAAFVCEELVIWGVSVSAIECITLPSLLKELSSTCRDFSSNASGNRPLKNAITVFFASAREMLWPITASPNRCFYTNIKKSASETVALGLEQVAHSQKDRVRADGRWWFEVLRQ